MVPIEHRNIIKNGNSIKNIYGNFSIKQNSVGINSYGGGYYCITYSTSTDWYWDPDGDGDPCHCSGNETYAYTTVTNETLCVYTDTGGNGDGGIGNNPPPTGSGGGSGGGSGTIYETRATDNSDDSGDSDSNPIGNEDTTPFSDFDPQTQSWKSVANVISYNDFVGWGTPGISKNCMSYAKAQIAKKGYVISDYFTNQTIQIYTATGGPNLSAVQNGVGYLLSALQRGIPVIVGVDDQPGSSNPRTDQTTDHFIVIVGSGTDASGNYFSFYDNASGDPIQGASSYNKLYYNANTGKITGSSATSYASGLIYTVTQIRKSK